MKGPVYVDSNGIPLPDDPRAGRRFNYAAAVYGPRFTASLATPSAPAPMRQQSAPAPPAPSGPVVLEGGCVLHRLPARRPALWTPPDAA
jgi:hypothetical protein